MRSFSNITHYSTISAREAKRNPPRQLISQHAVRLKEKYREEFEAFEKSEQMKRDYSRIRISRQSARRKLSTKHSSVAISQNAASTAGLLQNNQQL